MLAGLLSDSCGQLAQEVVGDQVPLKVRDAGLGAQRIESRQRTVADARAVDREHLADLLVPAPAAEHHLKHRALVGRKGLEGGHGEPHRREALTGMCHP